MYLGVDIGGTNIKSGILDTALNLVHSSSESTGAVSGFDNVLNKIINHIQKNLDEHPDISSIGVAVPGVVDSTGVIAMAPNLPGWEDIPLKTILSQSFKYDSIL